MKKLLLLFSGSLISLQLSSQNLIPILENGNAWGVSYSSAYNVPSGYGSGVQRVVANDTLVENVMYKVLISEVRSCYCQPSDFHCNFGVKCNTDVFKELIRQEGNVFYGKLANMDTIQNLAEFEGLAVGDSVFVNKRFWSQMGSSNGKYVISKIEITATQDRKKYWLEGYNGFYLDGVGFSGGGILPQPTRAFESGATLNCFISNGVSYSERTDFAPSGTPCMIISAVESIESKTFQPFIKRLSESKLALEMTEGTAFRINIYDINGNVSMTKECNLEDHTIDISGLAPGYYIGKAGTIHSRPFTFRFIK